MSGNNKLVIDGEWWLFKDEETKGDLKALIGMTRERLQLRKPSEAVIVLPDIAQESAAHRLVSDAASLCELMGLTVITSENVERSLYSLSDAINTQGDLPVWLSGRLSLYPMLTYGAVIERNSYGDLVSYHDLADIGLDNKEKIEDWLALSGTPKPIKKLGPIKAASILANKSLKALLEDKPSDRIEQAAQSQQATITENKLLLQSLNRGHGPVSASLNWRPPSQDKVAKLLSEYESRGWNEWSNPETRLPMNSIENPLSAKAQISLLQRLTGDVWGVKLITKKDKLSEIHIGRSDGNIRKWIFKLNDHNRRIMVEQIASFLSCAELKKVLSSTKDVARLLKDYGLEGLGGVVGDMSALQAFMNDKKNSYADLPVDEYASFHHSKLSLFDEKQKKYYAETEVKIGEILAEMEHAGVCADQFKLDVQQLELQNKIQFSSRFIEETIGSRPDDTDNFRSLVRESLGLSESSPLNAGVLKPLAGKSPLAKNLLEWRQSHTLSTQFIMPLIRHAENDGKVRTQYSSVVAVTGRLSSSKPALQNLPPEARVSLVPSSESRRVLSVDYKQMEIVVLAIASRDTYLLRSLASGRDIHRDAAAKMFNTSYSLVSEEQRRAAKEINFGIIYGMAVPTIAKKLGISKDEAAGLFKRHETQFPSIHKFAKERKEKALSDGFIKTLSGRKIIIPELKSDNFRDRSAALRKVVNYEMQGSSAEMVKRAMIESVSFIKDRKSSAKLIMQIHDELIFDIEQKEIEGFLKDISRIMKNACLKAWGMDAGKYFQTEAKAGKNLGVLSRIPPQQDLSENAGIAIK